MPLTIPNVYGLPRTRIASFRRVRTDVAGFVGFAGPRHMHQAKPLGDWRDFVRTYLIDDNGKALIPASGSRLADSVRAYFANGGARCYVVNVGSVPDVGDPLGAYGYLQDMLGIPRVPAAAIAGTPVKRTGLELLIEEDDVSYVDFPDLYADCPTALVPPMEELPPVFGFGTFTDCPIASPRGPVAGASADEGSCPLYLNAQVLFAQRYIVDRVARVPWKLFVLLSVPRNHRPKQAATWRKQLGHHNHVALYWPWIRVQGVPGGAIRELPPSAFAAGIVARRDIDRGPHIAPANAVLRSVVGLEDSAFGLDDESQAEMYNQGVNVIRAFDGYGIQLWGARTLLWSDTESPVSEPLSYVGNRRCLSAIERSAERIGREFIFESNVQMTWQHLSQTIINYLMGVFRSGALAGDRPEMGFQVRCDHTLNTRETVAQGRMICEVRVALVAPGEFIVFRLGRKGGLVEIEEG